MGIKNILLLSILALIILEFIFKSFNSKKKYTKKKSILFEENKKALKIDDPDMKEKTFNIYKKVCYSWSNLDMSDCKEIMGKEIYNRYVSQVNSLINKNQKNVMQNIELVSFKLLDKYKTGNSEIVLIEMKTKCRDYLMNTRTSKILNGHPVFLMYYTYELYFERKLNITKSNVCQKCNAIITNKKLNKCNYCGAKLNQKSYDYILVKKNLMEQKAKKTE